MMRGRYAAEAADQADLMLNVLERVHPGALAALQNDPLGELQRWPDISVALVTETNGGRCSVSGSYQYDATPPRLLVSRSRSIRRRGFTALHELGHHLQQTDLDLGQRVLGVQDSDAFEDAACDAFAARVLLPPAEVAGHFGSRGPTAPAVVELFHRSHASREACCVRAAEHLTGAGMVVLLDTAGTVLFAAPRGFVPPARGSDQSATALIAAALNASATVERDQTYVVYRTGDTSDALYGQAAWCDDDYLVAVLVSDNAAWRPFAPPRPNTGRSRRATWWTCETCGTTFRIAENPCERCEQPRCPDGHCGCTVQRTEHDRRCTRCFLLKHPNQFDGASTICRECSE